MAVVQISRIQQRRGKKQSATGFPQLASGEIGWAIDTQELYIGNGAVSEGAPYVGNTQILTEHVNILDFAEAYQYQRNNPIIKTGESFTTPIQRTIQERLDERVSVYSFGAKGNGIDDDTSALQRAIDQLFLNDSNKSTYNGRTVLYFEPGEYIISEELRVPPYAHLEGSGIDSTVINLSQSFTGKSVMRMVDANSTPGNYTPFASMTSLQRPKYINISNMTLKTNSYDSIILLDNTDSTVFTNIKFEGIFNSGGTANDTATRKQTGIWVRSASSVFCSENVQFYSCVWIKTGYGVYSSSDHNNLSFHDCKFYQLQDGFNIGGGVAGSINTKIIGCYFDLVDRYGIWVKLGYGNTSSNNKFMLVGNNNEGYSNATFPIIKFDTENNQSSDDYFERNRKLKDQNFYGSISFIPNIKSSSLITDNFSFRKNLEPTPIVPLEFFRFPIIDSTTYVIDYILDKTSSGSAVRTGTIHITLNINDDTYHIQDVFSYTGNSNVENIKFSASLEDFDGDGNTETLIIKIYNPVGTGIGTVNYSYRMLTR